MRVAIVIPPRYYWSFVNDYDHFMVPQAAPALAAAARAAGHEVTVIDCLPQRLGWNSLARRLRELRPQVLAAGENHAVFAHEIVKLARLAKAVDPAVFTVIGGTHFAFLDDRYLGGPLDAPWIDAIVRGEGEVTLVELLEELERASPDLARVPGVSIRRDGRLVRAPHRTLVRDLDSLPRPAYDLLPMTRYGRSSIGLAKQGTTIHHSRGCPSACDFCAFWINMADARTGPDGQTSLVARWRTKSVENTVAEIEYLHRAHDRQWFVFVDDTFNVDPRWTEAFADALLARRRRMKIRFYAFLRADLVLRDEKLGIFEKLVRAGLCHASIGVERSEDAELAALHKGFYTQNTVRQCMDLLRVRYPEVFRQATFLVGLREDTPQSLAALGVYARSLKPDYAGFHPITPIPGTPFWGKALREGWIREVDFHKYDWLTPVMPTDSLSIAELDEHVFRLHRDFVGPAWFARGLFGRGDYSRRLYLWWMAVLGGGAIKDLLRLRNPLRCDAFRGLRRPVWYAT